jgi:hypothetical protein
MPCVQSEEQKLEAEFKDKLIAEREIARQQAERDLRREIIEAKQHDKKVQEGGTRAIQELQKTHAEQIAAERESPRKEVERNFKHEIAEAEKRQIEKGSSHCGKLATRQTESKLEKVCAMRLCLRGNRAISLFPPLSCSRRAFKTVLMCHVRNSGLSPGYPRDRPVLMLTFVWLDYSEREHRKMLHGGRAVRDDDDPAELQGGNGAAFSLTRGNRPHRLSRSLPRLGRLSSREKFLEVIDARSNTTGVAAPGGMR